MNEKEKKNLIIISSVFIFILVFMVFFTFYRRDAMLSDRTIPKINTEIDPPSHGEVDSACMGACMASGGGTVYCTDKCSATPAPSSGGGNSGGSGSGGSSDPEPVVTAAPSCGDYDTASECPSYCQWCRTELSCKSSGASCATPVPTAAPTAVPTAVPTATPSCEDYDTVSECPSYCQWCRTELSCKAKTASCATPVPTATPTPTPESKITCYQLADNSCSSVSVTGSSCNESNGYYSSWTSCRSNIQCGSNEYLYGNSCLSCGTNKSVVSSKCQGNASTCCVSNTSTTGCEPGKYNIGSSTNINCVSCPDDYIATADNPTCHKYIAPGTCPAGSYTAGGTAGIGENLCTSCGAGKSSKAGATSAADCYSLDGVTTDECTVTTTTKARDVSYHGGNGNSDGSISSSQGYYVVEVEVNGKGCSGQTLTFNYDNTEGTGNGTYTVYDGFKMNYIAKITDQEVCNSTASVTGVLKDSTGKVTSTSNPATVNTSTDWGLTEKAQCVDKSYLEEHGRNSRNSAENADVDLYYIVLDQTIKNADGSISSRCPDPDNQLMVDVWTRACATCGGTPPTIPVTETDTPSLVYACYGNGRTVESSTSTVWATGSSSAYPYYLSGVSESDCHPYGCYTNGTDYKWVNNAPSGYTKVDNILSENMCKKEDEACYIDSAGEYKWGKYKNNPGYTLITSIVDSSKCRKMQNPACYTDGNIYLWDNSLPGSNFYIVDGIDDPTKCHPYEKPACYLYNDKYVWGQYASKSGYILVGGIEEKEYWAGLIWQGVTEVWKYGIAFCGKKMWLEQG